MNSFGSTNVHRGDDEISTIGDSNIGNAFFYPIPVAGITIGESMMSAGERVHVFGMMGDGRRTEQSTFAGVAANKTMLGDDATLNATYLSQMNPETAHPPRPLFMGNENDPATAEALNH
jgi:hypothetical protein